MGKKIVLMLLINIMFVCPTPASAANGMNEPAPGVLVQGEYAELLSNSTYQDAQSVYFLLRDVAGQFEFSLDWDNSNKIATVTAGNDTVKILFRDQNILKNNKSFKECFTYVENNNGRIVVEKQFLEELLGYSIFVLPNGNIDITDDSFTWLEDTITRIYPETKQFLLGTEKNGYLLQIADFSKIWDDTGLLNQFFYLQEGMVVSVKKSAIVGTSGQDSIAHITVVQSVDGGYKTVLAGYTSLEQNKILCGPDLLHPTEIITIEPDTIITDVNGNSLSLYDFKANDVVTVFHSPAVNAVSPVTYRAYKVINHIQLATGYLTGTGIVSQIDYENKRVSIFNKGEEMHFHLTDSTVVQDNFENPFNFQRLDLGDTITVEYQLFIVDNIPNYNEAAKITISNNP